MRFGCWLILAFALVWLQLPGSAVAQPVCSPPYKVQTADGRCVWSCAQGTQPDSTTNSCICQDGLVESAAKSRGRRICTEPRQGSEGQSEGQQGERPQAQSDIASNYPFNTRPHSLCRTYGRGDYAFPYRCGTSRERLRQFDLERRAFVTVYKSVPLRADITQTGRYTMRFNRPDDPPRNRDCDDAAIGVRGACVPSCYRVEYIKLRDSGALHALLGATGKAQDDCSGSLTTEYEPDNPGKALGYDRCWAEANRRRLDRWNHNVEVKLPRRVAAAYGFKDAHTVGSRGNWRYQLQIQHKMLYAEVELPVTFRCRQ